MHNLLALNPLVYLFLFIFPGNIFIEPNINTVYTEVASEIPKDCISAHTQGRSVRINLKKLDANYLGMCSITSFTVTVDIDSAFWQASNYTDRYAVMAHELTHCYLWQDHVDDPNHYMYYAYTEVPLERLKNQFREIINKECR